MFEIIKMVLLSIFWVALFALFGFILGVSIKEGYRSYKKEQYITRCVENYTFEECVQKYKDLQEMLKYSRQ